MNILKDETLTYIHTWEVHELRSDPACEAKHGDSAMLELGGAHVFKIGNLVGDAHRIEAKITNEGTIELSGGLEEGKGAALLLHGDNATGAGDLVV